MSLHAYQTTLGRIIRGPAGQRSDAITQAGGRLSGVEQIYLRSLLQGRGLPFTIDVQRSWCKGRARDAAFMTLSLLPEDRQQEFLDQWVERGGGTSSFFANEADAFLGFIAAQLEPRSHIMSICRMEQAVHRAARGNAELTEPAPPQAPPETAQLAASQFAAIVDFYCDPDQLFAALNAKTSLPEIRYPATPLLFAPWIPGYFRSAQEAEIAILKRLRKMTTLSQLRYEGFDANIVSSLFAAGAIAWFDDHSELHTH